MGSIPCQGQKCPSGCISISDCIIKNGVIANSTCFLCTDTQIYQNFSCQQVISCGQNMKALGPTCVCQDGFFFVNSTYCVKCPANAYWSGLSCQCNFGHYFANSSTCLACPAGSTYNPVKLNCDCAAGLFWFNASCITCINNQIWDATNQKCICAEGYSMANNACVLNCPANARATTTGCVCNIGFINISSKCVECPPQSAYAHALQSCVCLNGLNFFNGSCIACGNN